MENIFSEKRFFIPIASAVVVLLLGSTYYIEKNGTDIFSRTYSDQSAPAGSLKTEEVARDNDVVTVPSDNSVDPVSISVPSPSPVTRQKTSEANAVDMLSYPTHTNITATIFWVGETAGPDNRNISNASSAWDNHWVKSFGGVDDPVKRSGYFPAAFRPRENPFYFALPYNDFHANGSRKKDALSAVPWAKRDGLKNGESIVKNRWIKITRNGKVAYAQWEDVGPFGWDDAAYVFGNARPKNKENDAAGLDVSPAVGDFLGLDGIGAVDWQFADADQVPGGPWKDIVTTSQIDWK